jgi:flagellum-specific ATP synthase
MQLRSPASNALARLADIMSTAEAELPMVRAAGQVSEVAPSYYRVRGLSHLVRLGECVSVSVRGAEHLGEVVRIDSDGATVKPFGIAVEAGLGMPVRRARPLELHPHESWRGRTLDAMGRPIDGGAPLISGEQPVRVNAEPPAALDRQRISKPLKTGVRVIDLFTPICAGQRIGIFAGSGVGKSTLLAMLAKSMPFDTAVIALVGERGREVREFLEDALCESRARVIAVVSTSDESAMMRRLAPRTALAIAEYFRDRGEHVLLTLDSVTRYAHAARDVALSAGEPPVARGYTPSVFSDLPKLLERAGPGAEGKGAITGLFTVLVDGDDHNDPVADAVRGTLDGHIVLDRAIAEQGRYPAVNALASVSRLAQLCWTAEEHKLVLRLRAMLSQYEETRDLRMIGGYKPGTDAEMDKAMEIVPRLYQALIQKQDDPASRDAFREVASALAQTGGAG